jgi:hypothetical protein
MFAYIHVGVSQPSLKFISTPSSIFLDPSACNVDTSPYIQQCRTTVEPQLSLLDIWTVNERNAKVLLNITITRSISQQHLPYLFWLITTPTPDIERNTQREKGRERLHNDTTLVCCLGVFVRVVEGPFIYPQALYSR